MFRLFDPKNLVSSDKLAHLKDKLDKSLARLIRPSCHGGNPFIYSLICTKRHELIDTLAELPNWDTAATDGKKCFWHPDFLERLHLHEIPVVLQHESIHIMCRHVARSVGKDHELWAYVIEFCTNSQIESDYRKSKRYSKSQEKHALWQGNLGKPINIDTFIRILEGKRAWPGGRSCFVDINAYHQTPEQLYKKLKPIWDKSQVRCKECSSLTNIRNQFDKKSSNNSCPTCGSDKGDMAPMDGHIKPKVSKQETIEELVGAAERAKNIERGSVPAYVEELIHNLINPSVNLADEIRMSCMRESQNDGMKNDWKRPRRRFLSIGQYMPSRRTHKPRWLAMIDTSASMSISDIEHGLSQLQSLGDETDGTIVPCDADVHWDKATKVESTSDLSKTTIVGRGGTVFIDFFKHFPEKVGTDFDVIVIITDGFCGKIPIELAPSIDCLWVITRKDSSFNPLFGRVINLK